MQIDVFRAMQALINMGFRINKESLGIYSLDYVTSPSNPYNVVLDASRRTMPSNIFYAQLGKANVDIDIFQQQYNDIA